MFYTKQKHARGRLKLFFFFLYLIPGDRSMVLIANILAGHPTIATFFFI